MDMIVTLERAVTGNNLHDEMHAQFLLELMPLIGQLNSAAGAYAAAEHDLRHTAANIEWGHLHAAAVRMAKAYRGWHTIGFGFGDLLSDGSPHCADLREVWQASWELSEAHFDGYVTVSALEIERRLRTAALAVGRS